LFALGSLALTPRLLRIGLRWAESRDQPIAEREHPTLPLASASDASPVIVIGIGAVGRRLARDIHQRDIPTCAIDLSPANLHALAQHGVATIAGDARDPDVLERAGVDSARLVVVCVPDDLAAVGVVSAVRRRNRTCRIVARCRYVGTGSQLAKAGAEIIISEETELMQAFSRTLQDLDSGPSPESS
jgi:CPA2 family monovalent cation:H+ antiporter-2